MSGPCIENNSGRQILPNAANGQVPVWNSTLRKWVAENQGGGDVTAAGDNLFTGSNLFDIRPEVQFESTGLFEPLVALSDLNNYVTLSAVNQTIAGVKTFSQIIGATVGLQITANSAPTGAAGKLSIYADPSNRLSWRNGTGFTRTFDATAATANRNYSLPDFDLTIAGTNFAQTFTAVQSINLANSTGLTDFTINPTVKTSGNLFQASINGSSRASISNLGSLNLAVHCNIGGDFTTSNSGGQIKINDTKLGRGGADGIFVMMNNAENGFNRLCFGPATSSFSAIKSNGTTIDFVLANDAGGWSNIRAGSIQAASTVRLAASTASLATLNIPTGAAMTSHADGNLWLESDGTLYIRIGGVSKRFVLA